MASVDSGLSTLLQCLTVPKLRELLALHGVSVHSRARKGELIDMAARCISRSNIESFVNSQEDSSSLTGRKRRREVDSSSSSSAVDGPSFFGDSAPASSSSPPPASPHSHPHRLRDPLAGSLLSPFFPHAASQSVVNPMEALFSGGPPSMMPQFFGPGSSPVSSRPPGMPSVVIHRMPMGAGAVTSVSVRFPMGDAAAHHSHVSPPPSPSPPPPAFSRTSMGGAASGSGPGPNPFAPGAQTRRGGSSSGSSSGPSPRVIHSSFSVPIRHQSANQPPSSSSSSSSSSRSESGHRRHDVEPVFRSLTRMLLGGLMGFMQDLPSDDESEHEEGEAPPPPRHKRLVDVFDEKALPPTLTGENADDPLTAADSDASNFAPYPTERVTATQFRHAISVYRSSNNLNYLIGWIKAAFCNARLASRSFLLPYSDSGAPVVALSSFSAASGSSASSSSSSAASPGPIDLTESKFPLPLPSSLPLLVPARSPPPAGLIDLTDSASSPVDLHLDSESVRGIFQEIFLIPGAKLALSRAFEIAFNQIRNGLELSEVEMSRLLVISLTWLVLVDDMGLIEHVCFATNKWLSLPGKDPLIRFFSKADESFLKHSRDLMQSFITARVLSDKKVGLGLKGALDVLSLLRKGAVASKRLKNEDFYNLAVNSDAFELEADYQQWARSSRRHANFSFFNYPFLFDVPSKNRFIHSDSARSQNDSTASAFFDVLHGGGFSLFLEMRVRRTHIVPDAMQAITANLHNLRKPLRVVFEGEEGVDAGGVRKEFFQLVVRDLFDPKYGMFSYDPVSRLHWFHPHSTLQPDLFAEFELIGTILALAIYNNVTLDLHLPRALYKKLLGREVSLDDLDNAFPDLAHGLRQLLAMDPSQVAAVGNSFEISTTSPFGEVTTVELKPGGKDIPVTAENREEFVNLYMRHILDRSVATPFDSFRKGFEQLCDSKAFTLCEPDELEQMLCGSPILDFKALEQATNYVGFGDDFDTEQEPRRKRQATLARRQPALVSSFWEVIHSLPLDQQKKFLSFVTGCDRVPVSGLGGLKFVIQHGGRNPAMLPTAHTCFNTLILPEYPDKEMLRAKLLIAIDNSEGFGMK